MEFPLRRKELNHGIVVEGISAVTVLAAANSVTRYEVDSWSMA